MNSALGGVQTVPPRLKTVRQLTRASLGKVKKAMLPSNYLGPFVGQVSTLELQRKIVEFARYHRSRGNRVCHYLGIPLISVAVLGALAEVGDCFTVGGFSVRCDLAIMSLIITLLYEMGLNRRIAIGIFIAGMAAYAIAQPLSPSVLASIFCLGWALQFTGHRIFEKNSPAFFDNLVHLFIGPRWLINKVVRAVDE